ncbi:tautomerase family protein [uncultured Mucilaginibacter sp.]|uniref:tautomerase family protein n=1 Tax=uncultured Mucilaginibacter sp. TaxID=797541 RepID=UPI0025F7348F|nr:tautomerase family protein [uncultured Mucilaginibacter sp.]
MPHVILKIYEGRTEEQKTELAERLMQAVISVTKQAEGAVSVSIEDIKREDWVEDVYKPDILGNWDKLYKKPGYNPL